MTKNEILSELDMLLSYQTPIVPVTNSENNIFVKKEDCIPFSFGGNKCRIAASYFKQLVSDDCDVVITYGASSSNLCRVIANMSSRYGIKCVIVTPDELAESTCNSEMVEFFGAEKVLCPLNDVHGTIEQVISSYSKTNKPYFIYGGGHGVPGTDSYREVLRQVVQYEKQAGIEFDYIFITLATGTSMSGLIVENEISKFNKHIIGISIAREYGRVYQIMKDSLSEYDVALAGSIDSGRYEFLDDFRCGGYGKYSDEILESIKNEMKLNGLNLDTTYTGKSFYGMKEYLHKNNIRNNNVLFIHTGGTPLFFKDGCKYLNL